MDSAMRSPSAIEKPMTFRASTPLSHVVIKESSAEPAPADYPAAMAEKGRRPGHTSRLD
jgi:hypothetical protein